MDFKYVNNCRLCGAQVSDAALTFPDTPLANEFLAVTDQPQETFPLALCVCSQCAHIQLTVSVDRDRLFRNYLYVSGTSPVFVEHFKKYAESVYSMLERKHSFIVDIGSNDGTLLQQFKNLGCDVLGFDPAANLAQQATEKGIRTIPSFFNKESAWFIAKHLGVANVITANNVFAHLDDFEDFIVGVKRLLAEDGMFIFEVSYFKDVLDKCLFDTIYHEHTSYHLVSSLSKLFECHGMTLFHAERVDTHGGSIRCFAMTGQCEVSEGAKQLLEEEKCLNSPETCYQAVKDFSNKINNLKTELLEKLNALKKDNKKIAAYGAPAKATTLMYAFDLNKDIVDFVIDDSPLKQNLFTPGKYLPIKASNVIDSEEPDYILILAWNFYQSIINKTKFNGKWIVPIPEIKEI